MTEHESKSMNKTGYFLEFALPTWFHGPASVRALLEELWNQCYPDLYEEDCADPKGLVDAEHRVLAACLDDGLGHQRLVWMALTFCAAAAVTVDAYLPGDPRPARVIARLEEWLRDPDVPTSEDFQSMFPQTVTPPQALHEALDVLYQGLKALDSAGAAEALHEILDDCMEGYAIFPGSDGRRDLFNWWLLDVVPASWCLQKPGVLYTMRLPWPP